MTDWQQRVVDEKRELDAKLVKLDVFIHGSVSFANLDVEDKCLLIEQRSVMFHYSRVLGLRIELFKST
jgi:hypothetical protein